MSALLWAVVVAAIVGVILEACSIIAWARADADKPLGFLLFGFLGGVCLAIAAICGLVAFIGWIVGLVG